MNETTEITEDNCVLDQCDFDTIDVAFSDYLKACSNAGKGYLAQEAATILLKIQKLNELAEEKQNERG